MAIIEGTGIKAAGSEAQKKAKKVAQVYYGGIEAEKRRQLKKDLDKFMKDFGGTPASDKFNPKGRGMDDRFDPTAKAPTNFFSPDGGAVDKRNNIKLASADLSNFEASGFSDDEGGSDTSTFGTSFTDQAKANIADASIYKQKEDNIYRDTTDAYKDFKSTYEKDSTEDTVKSIEKFYNLDPKGVKYTPRDESQFGETPTKGAFPGQEDKVITTKEKITGVRDFGYMKGDQLFGTFKKQQGGLGIGAALDQNKYGLVPRLGGLGGLYSSDDVTQSYVKAMMQNKADIFSSEERNRLDKINNPQNYNADGSLKTLDQKYGSFLNEKDKAEKEYANRLGYNTYADYQKAREEKSNEIDSKLNAAFTKKEEKKEPSVLQKVGNFLGSVTNTVLGIQPAYGSQIGGALPSGTETPTTGDTSFSAYVKGGGAGQERGTTTPTAAPKQTVASLPSNYKQTEAREFAKAKAFQQAKKNPNVKVGVDSKGQPTAAAANDSGRARAQAAAFNRRMSGKSISQTKAANKAAVRKSAAERQAAFKKTRKSTVGQRRAAAKASVKAAAKKRHSAFKKRRAARKKSKKGKK